MLAILTSHPIQYQVPIWRALAVSGQTPFQVWFLTNHGMTNRTDREFGKAFAWDIDLTTGYPHHFLGVRDNWNLRSFYGVRLTESLQQRFRDHHITDLWVEGWRLKPFWDAIRIAKKCGVRVWMRGDSNDLRKDSFLKSAIKGPLIGHMLRKVDNFLCVGNANRRLYESYGVPRERFFSTPHCVDNDRFHREADSLIDRREAIRAKWQIPADAFCLLFCGKFIEKKHPGDLIAAASLINGNTSSRRLHLLFVGSGELGRTLRAACNVLYDSENEIPTGPISHHRPNASFAGFLNQSQIVQAYLAADLLVLPSDSGETWGLVANEAMACGTPATVSNLCGCAEDLVAPLNSRLVFGFGDVNGLANSIEHAMGMSFPRKSVMAAVDTHHLRHTVNTVTSLYCNTDPQSIATG